MELISLGFQEFIIFGLLALIVGVGVSLIRYLWKH